MRAAPGRKSRRTGAVTRGIEHHGHCGGKRIYPGKQSPWERELKRVGEWIVLVGNGRYYNADYGDKRAVVVSEKMPEMRQAKPAERVRMHSLRRAIAERK